MKKFVVSVLLLFVLTLVSAQIIQKNDASKYRIIPKQEKWGNTEIIVENNVHPYLSFIPEAILKPGKPILVEKTTKTLKLRPIFKKLVKVEKREIVYDDLNKRIRLIKSSKQREEGSSLIVFALISLICMILVNILMKINKRLAAIVAVATVFFTSAASVTTFVALVSAITGAFTAIVVAAYALAFIISFIAALTALFIVIVIDIKKDDNYKNYRFYSIVYYILIIIYFVLLFI